MDVYVLWFCCFWIRSLVVFMVEKIYYEDVIGNILYNIKIINYWIKLLYVVLYLY